MRFRRIQLWLLSAWLALPAIAAPADRWEKEIAAFEQLDRERGSGLVDVLLFGSSSFRLWKEVDAAFPGLRILNRGFGGSEMSDLVHYLDRVVSPHSPRVLLIYGGDNDLAAGRTPAEVMAHFADLVGRVRRQWPATRIGFVAVKPSPVREHLLEAQAELNRQARRFARRHRRVDFLDAATPLLDGAGQPDPKYFLADRLHLNAAGYEIWRQVLGPYLARRTRP